MQEYIQRNVFLYKGSRLGSEHRLTDQSPRSRVNTTTARSPTIPHPSIPPRYFCCIGKLPHNFRLGHLDMSGLCYGGEQHSRHNSRGLGLGGGVASRYNYGQLDQHRAVGTLNPDDGLFASKQLISYMFGWRFTHIQDSRTPHPFKPSEVKVKRGSLLVRVLGRLRPVEVSTLHEAGGAVRVESSCLSHSQSCIPTGMPSKDSERRSISMINTRPVEVLEVPHRECSIGLSSRHLYNL